MNMMTVAAKWMMIMMKESGGICWRNDKSRLNYVYSVFIVHSIKRANCTLAPAFREWEETGEENGEQSERSC